MSAVLRGEVTIKTKNAFKSKVLPGNWGVLYDAGRDDKPPYIELFEEKSAPKPLSVIKLEHLKFPDKTFRHPDTQFALAIKKEKHYFEFDSASEKEDWVQALCHVSSDLWKQRASAMDSSELEENENSDGMNENLLYDSFDRVQKFKVSVNPTKASESNKLKGNYMLNPTRDSLRLLDHVSFMTVHEWPYRQIRKYGRTRNIFRMEVGRRCTTGEGEFEFFTPEGTTLTDLITLYTKQSREREDLAANARLTPSESTENRTPSPTQSPVPFAPHRRSTEMQRKPEQRDSFPQRGSSVMAPGSREIPKAVPVHREIPKAVPVHREVPRAAVPINREVPEAVVSQEVSREIPVVPPHREVPKPCPVNRDVPKPAPRTVPVASAKEESRGAKMPVEKMTSDTKIYEHSSGLTAPLDSNLKTELASKLSLPEPLSKAELSAVHDDAHSDTSSERHNSISETTKDLKKVDKKKLEKEQKKREKEEAKREKEEAKREKEEAKLRKQQEKEREKKLKKESKAHSKVDGRKSSDSTASQPTAAAASELNIYDEPGELVPGGVHDKRELAESAYAEPDAVLKTPPPVHQSSSAKGAAPDLYATPTKPKNGWKQHARPESDNIHVENYDQIKMAALSQSKGAPPARMSLPLSSVNDDEDTYNRLGDFQCHSENPYGMSSAVETLASPKQPPQPINFAPSNEYEDADQIQAACVESNKSHATQHETKDSRALTQQTRFNINVPSCGDYADVS